MWKSVGKHFKLPNKLTNKFVKKQVPDEEIPDDREPSDERKARRFRVLVLGPANSGKTTLLERLTESPAGAAIVIRNGRRIKNAPKGYDQRGIHNVDDEITYASNPNFVFHDSGGFEAGGVKEVEIVWQFIQKCSLAPPSQQLHAIWLCIPTDNDRPFGFLHSGFFSKPTASVPVIGIFTKLDGRQTKVQTNVLGSDPSPADFRDRAPEVELKVAEFLTGLETQFRKEQYPPAGFIRVGNMHEDTEQSTAFCNQLLRATMDAVPDETRRSLLRVTVWKRNRRVHTIYVLERVLKTEAEGKIMARSPGPQEDEESELRANKGFSILMELYGHETHYEYKPSSNLEVENEYVEAVYRRDVDAAWARWWTVHVTPEDFDDGIKACVPLLRLLHHQPIPPNPHVQYLVFSCLVILWIRGGKTADSLKEERTASLILAQIKSELVDNGDLQGLHSYDIARRLAIIIDAYTPL